MTLTPSERAWVLETERRTNEMACMLQKVAYAYSQMCTYNAPYDPGLERYYAYAQRIIAAVSLAERVLRGVERIGDI